MLPIDLRRARTRSRTRAALTAGVVLLASLPAATPASARDHLGWRRDARGQLVLGQVPRGAPSHLGPPPGAGTLQRLPMPPPPGETAFDRALARERKVVTQERAKRRAALEAHAEALRDVAARNRAEVAAAEAKRRAPRADRTRPPKKRTHAKHTDANRSTHRGPPEPVAAPGESGHE
jgi:hypothetical protein